jgi:hypothetical protein
MELGDVILYADSALLPAPGIVGRLFFASDTFEILRDNGAAWVVVTPTGADFMLFERLANKGIADGYAPLDSDGVVPLANLPPGVVPDLSGYEVLANKGAANGYAPLGADSKVPALNLPDAPDLSGYELLSHKGAANGYAPLGVDSKVPSANLPTRSFIISPTYGGKPLAGQYVVIHPAVVPFTIAANAAGSRFIARAAATGSSVFSMKKNTVEFGTITFAAGGTVATFSAFAQQSFDPASNDVFEITAPAVQDATLANIGGGILGSY